MIFSCVWGGRGWVKRKRCGGGGDRGGKPPPADPPADKIKTKEQAEEAIK